MGSASLSVLFSLIECVAVDIHEHASEIGLGSIGRDVRVADQHGIPGGQETRQSKTYLTVDNLTGFYARNSRAAKHD